MVSTKRFEQRGTRWRHTNCGESQDLIRPERSCERCRRNDGGGDTIKPNGILQQSQTEAFSWIQAGIGQVETLRETIVFKGGTALKKCYYLSRALDCTPKMRLPPRLTQTVKTLFAVR